ncbi:MAG: phage minor head protein [Candidatus Saccharimonadales bacterium]
MTKKTSKQNNKALDRMVVGYEAQLKRDYEKSLKTIRGQLAKIYEKSDGNYVDAVKFNRLSSLEKQIGKEIIALSKITSQNLQNGIYDTFAAAKMREFFAIEKELGFAIDFTMMNKKAIKQAVINPYDRIGFVKRNKLNGELLARQVSQEIVQGLIQGKSFRQTASVPNKRMGIGAGKARTIVRTETHRVRGIARAEVQEEAVELGVQMQKMWVSAIDTSTREDHADADGQTVDVDDYFSVGSEELMFPGDPVGSAEQVINCRCTTIAVIKGYEPTVRRVRDSGIVKYETFREWEKTRDIPVRG